MNIPAICPNGHIFNSGISVAGGSNVYLSGNTSRCPTCGQPATVAEGMVNSLNGFITELSFNNYDAQRLRLLRGLIKPYAKKSIRREDLDQLLEKMNTEVPELKSLADLIPKSRTDAYTVIMILLTIIGMILQQCHDDKPVQNINVTNVINEAINQVKYEQRR